MARFLGVFGGIAVIRGQRCGGIEESVDLSAHNIGAYLTEVTSAAACCAACQQTPGCLFWTHVAASEHCYVKTSDAGRRTLSGHVSGSVTPPGAPVIGIYPTLTTNDYLLAYKQWLAQEGAASVELPVTFSVGELESLFQSINGLLIPGGSRGLDPSAKAMVERAVQANEGGDFFPVWGTCDGYEWIVEIFGGKLIKSGSFDSEDFPHTLNFTDALKTSRIYASANQSLISWLGSENITFNAHNAGVDPADPMVPKKFNVLATDADRKGKRYIAQIEGKTLPIYANQFHPEKIQFVHNSAQPSIPRTPHAVASARHLAQFFVSEAKKNTHAAPSPSPLVRLAFYSGNGTGSIQDLFAMIATAAAKSFGPDRYSVATLDSGSAVTTQLSRDAFDIIVFPGGSGNGQAKELGASGQQAVLDFVAAGGGYIGTCGGAYLGLQHLYFYGYPAPKTQPYPTACHAHGCNSSVGISAAGLEILGLKDKQEFAEDVTIMYHNGPIVLQADLPSSVTVLAAFHKQGAPWSSTSDADSITIPVNSTAISSRQNSTGGRVVLNAPHPEHLPGLVISSELYAAELNYVLPLDRMIIV